VTTSEACGLIVDLTRQLAAARGELDAARAELAAARAELAAYREIVSVALTQLHEMTRQLERERASRYRLVEEFRALREKGRNKPAA
jgi:chromosome segregation ATPase